MEKHCLNCGKPIPHKNKFCSCSCAATYNNKKRPPMRQEIKDKIRVSVLKRFTGKKNLTKINEGEYKINDDLKIKYTKTKDGRLVSTRLYKKICPNCNKEFYGVKRRIYCSNKCVTSSELVKEKLRQKAYQRIENGTHVGWQSRNISSYPENFWKTVLDNNNIKYKREDFSTKKYFLDFLIVKHDIKIDLEIDGKQHKRQQSHDEERDRYLIENGFVVYRIKWNEINTKSGKEEMKIKIDKFLDFYHNI